MKKNIKDIKAKIHLLPQSYFSEKKEETYYSGSAMIIFVDRKKKKQSYQIIDLEIKLDFLYGDSQNKTTK